MTSLADIDDLTIIYRRPAVSVSHCQIGKSAQHIKPCQDAAVLLNGRNIGLDLRHQLSIYL